MVKLFAVLLSLVSGSTVELPYMVTDFETVEACVAKGEALKPSLVALIEERNGLILDVDYTMTMECRVPKRDASKS